MTLHPEIEMVTERIIERSRATRGAYLDLIARERESGVDRPMLSCGNLAHGFAAAGDDKRVDPRRQDDEHRHRHRLQRHAVGASTLRPLPRSDEAVRARGRRDGAGRRRGAGDVRRGDSGAARHGALAVQPRHHRPFHGDCAQSRHVRGCGAPRHLRQDRARAPDRRAPLRSPAGDPRAGRPDAVGACQQGEAPHPRALRRGQDWARRTARG